jgi:lipooligosaccharide transport system permease protein
MIEGWAIWVVWRRYFAIYRKDIRFGLTTTFVEPILYLLSFGYGLGTMVGTIQVDGIELTYRQFIFAGIAAQTVLFQGFFEAAYGSFVRMYYQRIYQAMAMTPITLAEVLWGELLWDATKGSIAAAAVLLIGGLTGDFLALGALAALPVTFLSALLFAALGLLSAAWAASIDEISYPQFLFIFPMFLFCGVFYPLDQLPAWLQTFVWFLPLTPVVSLLRSLTLGTPIFWGAIPLLLIWLAAAVRLSRQRMLARLIK